MWISTRTAISVLRAAGVGSNSARRALRVGLAGPARVTASATLYDRDAVLELASRPAIRPVEAFELSPRGLFLARVDVDVTASPQEQRDWLQAQWDLVSPWNLVNRRIEIRTMGPLPLISSTGTFVTAGADIVDVVPLARRYRLILDEPGEWFRLFEGHRMCGGPGRPWDIYSPDYPWPDHVRIGT